MISVFGAIFMFIMGVCIKNNYKYVGEWYKPEELPVPRGSPTQAQIDEAAKNCFIVMAMYIGFTCMALACLFFMRSKGRRT